MPDLGNLITMPPIPAADLNPSTELDEIKKSIEPKSLDDHLSEWVAKNDELGAPKSKSYLPFLVNAPKLSVCLVCESVIYPGEEIACVVRGCKGSYHLQCARDWLGFSQSSKAFKCPQHVCYLCKKSNHIWRCSKCYIASHDKCAAFPEYVLHSSDHPSQAICWKHEWPPSKPAVPTNSIEEFFCRLPLPCTMQEFNMDLISKDPVENGKLEPVGPPGPSGPSSYVQIRRNIYLVKKKRDDTGRNIGCTDCSSSTCSKDCVCRSLSISCSKACKCSDACTNKPFRKEKKIKIVLTKRCGWGVEATEPIKKGEFIIEYVGEVISDAMCEQRLWDMKHKENQNFYMCEIRRDFTIDATFKGNASRFLNHSCNPNCDLEKWNVEGETRVGVFAAKSIKVGEPLTYDYRFVQFGTEVECQCGAASCRGYLGSKKKARHYGPKPIAFDWGAKRQRTTVAWLRINTP
ncbi:histone-lysine N-methyltransferase ASHR3-like [Bidens hawaiensis]|uniref:histone-lysine N-methyltransferase ASHR3-like n=1 Tax=Bidens hawaiensis TaxID=980011 RepID=UPI00404AA931